MKPSPAIRATRFGASLLAVFALISAGGAAYIGSEMMSANYTQATVVSIVVANQELPVGDPITRDELTTVEWPQPSVPEGAYTSIEALLSSSERITPTVGILPGEPIVKKRLADTVNGTGVAALIAANMRAVALEVDASVAKTGLVYPGAFVDVVVTFRNYGDEGPTAITAVQHAQVLSVGLDADVATRRDKDGRDDLAGRNTTYITLEVSPTEAEIIGIARNEGKIDIALRNGGDDALVESRGVRPESLLPNLDDLEDPEMQDELADSEASEDNKAESTTRKRRKRRIRLVARDGEDQERRRSRIETYRAN